ncbi:cytochrome P450 [Lipomyces arxii]|uniref:cytochrome P450 n=1 Tax=Lipomyces arxii TaxID=56418 RepID=UPI0034CD64D7
MIYDAISIFENVDFGVKLLVAFLALLVGLWFLVRRRSLYHVPGPTVTMLTDWWILWQTFMDRRDRVIDSLHAKYGPVVRLGPHEVVISDPAYLKQVYVGNFDKSDFYSLLGSYDTANMFSSLTKEAHASKRRVVHQLYSKVTVTAPHVEAAMRELVDRTAVYYEKAATTHEPIDVLKLFRSMAMDIITAFQYGSANGTDFIRNGKERDLVQEHIEVLSSGWFVVSYLPKLAMLYTPKHILKSLMFVEQWALDLLAGCGKTEESVANKLRKGGFTEKQTQSETLDHVLAGQETSAMTQTYMLWNLTKYPEVVTKLRKELETVCKTDVLTPSESLPPFKVLDKLPYLAAVLQETLRLFAPAAGTQARIVPPGGMWYTPSSPSYGPKNMKVFIPEGTTVSLQARTVHRDPGVFDDPEKFDPDRWINSTPEKMHAMNKSFFAFGAGVRMCVGMNLAMLTMKLNISHIFSHYTVKVGGSTTDETMTMLERFPIRPKTNDCFLIFEKV